MAPPQPLVSTPPISGAIDGMSSARNPASYNPAAPLVPPALPPQTPPQPLPPVINPLTGAQPLPQPPAFVAPATPSSTPPQGAADAGKPKPPDKKKLASTQNSMLVSEIRDGLVIMRDGSLRAVVMCQSINFDLMSPQEREGVELSYQGFLNSLYFPVQIFIRSQRVNLKTYMDKLQQIHNSQENILLGLLMEDYIAYVQYLVESANIMDKQFYVVIPYYPPLMSTSGLAINIRKLTTIVKPAKKTVVINETDFNKYKSELTQQVQVVLGGLQQIGIQSVPLNTQELIELYYNVYNPQTAGSEHLTNVADLETPVVSKGQGQAPTVLTGGA